MIVKRTIMALIVAGITSGHAAADVNWSGYGSIVGGKTLNDNATFTADFYDVGQYTSEWTFKPDSMFALQVDSQLSDKLKLTAQLVAKGVDEFKPELDWLYLSYQANDNFSLKLGRRMIPMFYFSEQYEIGYAYPWIRPPSDLYWWQVTQFNGVQGEYRINTEDFSHSLNLFYGNEYTSPNKTMTFYLENDLMGRPEASAISENWTNIVGAQWNVSNDIFDLRVVYFTHDQARTYNITDGIDSPDPVYKQRFFGIGGSIELYPVTILFDYNHVKRDNQNQDTWPSYLLSALYTHGDFQPYIAYSNADQYRKGGVKNFEEHYQISYGVRYNMSSQTAFKIQYDDFVDKGDKASGWDFHGDSQVLSLGVDFVF